MAEFPPFAFTTQESWYGELSFKAAEDGSPLSLAGRQFEMWITPASSGAQLVPPAIVLTMEAGRGLSLKQGDPSTLVFRVPKTTANDFPRTEFTGDVLEVVEGERYLFMPVRITYAEPSGLRSFLTRFLGVSVSFAARQQPIYTPLAVPGREGRPGATILRGTVPPVPADGKDDDYYIEDRTASGQGRRMWGPKAGGQWPGTPWVIQVARISDVPDAGEAAKLGVSTVEQAQAANSDAVALTPAKGNTLLKALLGSTGFTSTAGSILRGLQARFSEAINVLDEGAMADFANGSGTDNTAAFQRAITKAIAQGKHVYVPDGRYFFALASPPLDPGLGPLTFRGQSRSGTVLHWDEGGAAINTGIEKYLFRNGVNTNKSELRFQDFSIKGTFDTVNLQGGGNAMQLRYYPSVVLQNCGFLDLRRMGAEILFCGRLLAVGNEFINLARDAIRTRDTSNTTIRDNYIQRCGDDAIAAHVSREIFSAGIAIRSKILIEGNRIYNSGPIKVLGGRSVKVVHNQMDLCMAAPIWVGYAPGGEADVSPRDIQVTDNEVLNSIKANAGSPGTGIGPADVVIIVRTPKARGASSSGDAVPGEWNASAGKFERPWDWSRGDAGSSASPLNPAERIIISRNTIGRTRPVAAKFSDYGYGSICGVLGEMYDPAVTDDHLRPLLGISLGSDASFVDLDISGNIIEHVRVGVILPPPTRDVDYVQGKIKDNKFRDILNRGVTLNGGSSRVDVQIDDNEFDMDPYRVNANSNVDGSYKASGLPAAIDVGNNTGLTVRRNRVRNSCVPFQSTVPSSHVVSDNLLITGAPVTLSTYDAGNKGVGVVRLETSWWTFEIIDADPTSPTCGQIKNTTVRSANAMPSTGWYPRGWFVANNAPSIAGGKSTLGWLRITTGTAHVSGTDWQILVIPSA